MFRSEEQVSLIRSSWPELFVLGLTQCSTQIHIEELMVTVATSLQVVEKLIHIEELMVTVATSLQV